MKLCPACNETFDATLIFCPHDGEVLYDSPETIVGQIIDGKYRVEGFIAQGGMGAVYRARHILLGDLVVIKTLRPEMRNNAEWLKRFQREGQAARSFRHPNSVTVYDLSTGSDGMIYMVMEYVEGHTLDKELKQRGRFTPEEALAVLAPVADVLDSAHKRGVIHRDLKPENIMLGAGDRSRALVKVLDLGIAKLVGADGLHATDATTSLTIAGQILGTPYYMSPEQWGETPRDGNPVIDARTDIYSLGVIFFELVAGCKPHQGRTVSELRQQHVGALTPKLCENVPVIPAAFSHSIAHAMAKDRADRPQTAGAFIDEVRAALKLPLFKREGDDLHAAQASGEDHSERATIPLIMETTLDAVATERSKSGNLHKEPLTRARRRRIALTLVCGTLFAALLLGFGGWYVRRDKGAVREISTVPTAAAEATPAVASKVEIINYWFEVLGQSQGDKPFRVAEVSPEIASGHYFRLHFKSPRPGYLYLIGPNERGNALMTFLTAQGGGSLRSNVMLSDADFRVASMKLDDYAGTEEYTAIFSPKPLASPAFLTGKPEHELTPAEVIELDEFRARYSDAAPELTERGEGRERAVAVAVQEASVSQSRPIIFNIRLEHK